LLLARYIPRPSAERLIESRINFVDQAGNMHLVQFDAGASPQTVQLHSV
jgi:hypothetical protein